MTFKVYIKYFNYPAVPGVNYYYITNDEQPDFVSGNDYLRRNGVWGKTTYTVSMDEPDSGTFVTIDEAIALAKSFGYEVVGTTVKKIVIP
jgi:hypothetical protein